MSVLLRLIPLLRSEPVRGALYPLLVALVAWLVGKGLVDGGVAFTITGVIAALLGITATEGVRAAVTPVEKVVAVGTRVVEQTSNAFANDGKIDRQEVEAIGKNVFNDILTRLNIRGIR